MKTTIFAAGFNLFLFAAATLLAQDKPEATPVDGTIEWVFDLEEGQRLAKQSNRPLFIVFRCER